MAEWISAAEEKPPDLQRVLFFVRGYRVELGQRIPFNEKRELFHWYTNERVFNDDGSVTHWMPLPEEPR